MKGSNRVMATLAVRVRELRRENSFLADEVEGLREALLRLTRLCVREREHPDCPPEQKFVTTLECVPGSWPCWYAAAGAVYEAADARAGLKREEGNRADADRPEPDA